MDGYSIQRMSSRTCVNVKLVARDAIGRSTLGLKGKPCNGGNSENYINARNRKVYTMIELHGVGLLAEGQSASRWRFEFFLSVTRVEQLYRHIFFSVLPKRPDFWRVFIFGRISLGCAKKKHLRYSVFGKSMLLLFPSLTGIHQGDALSNDTFFAGFQFQAARARTPKKKTTDIHFFQ